MKRGSLILSIVLLVLLVASGCQKTVPATTQTDQTDSGNGYDQQQDTASGDSQTESQTTNGYDADDYADGDYGARDEEVYAETGCDADLMIAKVFEIVGMGATGDDLNEQIMAAMCLIDCEEVNPEYYNCA